MEILGTVYTADQAGDSISLLDTATNQLIATVPAGDEPHNVQISPDGQTLWMTNAGIGKNLEQVAE